MSGDNGVGAFTEEDLIKMIEEDYNSESLRFIYNLRNDFVPVLTKIVTKLNDEKVMKIANNSNLQNLIVKLTEYTIIKGKKGEKNKKIIVDHGENISAYVKRCIELMNVKPTKDNIHNLFLLYRKDIKENEELQGAVTELKKADDWKKMVGMLIPKGASVKLHIDGGDLMEQTTNNWVSSNTHVSIGDNVEGKVVERFYRSGPKFKKIVKIPEGLVGHVYTSNKGSNLIEVDPEAIQLIESEPAAVVASGPPVGTGTAVEKGKGTAVEAEAGAAETVAAVEEGKGKGEAGAVVEEGTVEAATETGEATGATGEAGAVVAAVVAAQHELQLQKGGSQRLTRKNTKTMGTARKTRTNH